MTDDDLDYVRGLLGRGLLEPPVLELGAGYGGATCRGLVEGAGLAYLATDRSAAPGVEAADFETGEGVPALAARGPFGTLLVLNVLEHVLEPVAVLDRSLALLAPGGRLVTVTPAAWPLHEHPVDCCRLLPDFFERFAETRGVELDRESFVYVGLGPVGSFRDRAGRRRLPPAGTERPLWRHYSRLLHALFRTFGREVNHGPRVALGAVLRRP